MKKPEDTAAPRPHQGTLGTFAGVFTPSVLTILGIILFLRLGYVVGGAGMGRALLIIGLANTISVLTSISLSAVATNLKVKGGGDYYLISRTLGLEFGGAIGIVLFLAQSVSIAFYCIGFAEAVSALLPADSWLSGQLIAVAAVAFLFVLAWMGADWATKFQYGVMTLLVAAIASFFAGGLSHWHTAQLVANWSAPPGAPGFWILFAIFFPAVTGFTQGVSMSGDLKDPGKSLPAGTFMAVGVSILVYFAVAAVFAGNLDNADLMGDYGAMKRLSRYGLLIDAGVIAATLSSAMASFLGAPRILQSLAADRTFGFLLPFAKGSGPTGNPRRGVLLSAGIALVTIGLGQLNLVARVVSMFFLISYGLLNYATYFEARADSPSFRPRFKWFHPWTCLVGFTICLLVMVAIDFQNSLIAGAILIAIYQYLKHADRPDRWADANRSYYLQRARTHLLAAAAEPDHPRNWRPQILALTHDRPRRQGLLTFSAWLEGRSGMTTMLKIVDDHGPGVRDRIDEQTGDLAKDVELAKTHAFSLVVAADDITESLPIAVQAAGIGPLRANTVLVNAPDQIGRGVAGIEALKYAQSLRTIVRLGCHALVLAADEHHWDQLAAKRIDQRRIDIWWHEDASSRLLLLLAYLVTRHDDWQQARLRMLAPDRGRAPEAEQAAIEQVLADARIEAEAVIVADASADTVIACSADAALVMMPLRIRDYRLATAAGDSFNRVIRALPLTVMGMAAGDIDLDAAPEEGHLGEMAAAMDAFTSADKKARQAEKDAHQARRTADVLQKQILAARSAVRRLASDTDEDQLEDQARKADAQSEKARRRAIKARVKAEDAARQAREMGVDIERPEDSDPPTD